MAHGSRTSRRPRRRRRASGALIAAACLLAVAGCGGKGRGHRPVETTPLGAQLPKGVKAALGMPSGKFAGQPPKAVLLIIHGGGWLGNNPAQFTVSLTVAKGYQNLGYETVAVEYRAGAQGIEDVDGIYRRVRRMVGPRMPICATGGSAGAHIALMLAVRHPDLDCVIALGGPTDLPALAKEASGKTGNELATSAFGSGDLAKYSPALHGGQIKAKVLLAYAANDPIVPVQQGYLMKKADPDATLTVLPAGPIPFVHSGISVAAKQQVTQQQLDFLQGVADGARR
jgi:acetyl esterase/lipase